jgi:hypothetical protein
MESPENPVTCPSVPLDCCSGHVFRKYFHPIDDESGRNPSISAAFRIFGTLDLPSISFLFSLLLPRPVISFKEEQRFCQCGSWRPFYM